MPVTGVGCASHRLGNTQCVLQSSSEAINAFHAQLIMASIFALRCVLWSLLKQLPTPHCAGHAEPCAHGHRHRLHRATCVHSAAGAGAAAHLGCAVPHPHCRHDPGRCNPCRVSAVCWARPAGCAAVWCAACMGAARLLRKAMPRYATCPASATRKHLPMAWLANCRVTLRPGYLWGSAQCLRSLPHVSNVLCQLDAFIH